jgi:hypothetical protein
MRGARVFSANEIAGITPMESLFVQELVSQRGRFIAEERDKQKLVAI